MSLLMFYENINTLDTFRNSTICMNFQRVPGMMNINMNALVFRLLVVWKGLRTLSSFALRPL